MKQLPRPVIFSLLDTPAFGGAEQYLAIHLLHLNSLGYQVVLGTNNQQVMDEVRKRIVPTAAPFEVIHAPYRLDFIGNWKGLVKYFVCAPWAVVWLVWTLLNIRRQQKVICYVPGFSDRLTFAPFIKLLGMPLIWIEYGPLEPVFPRSYGIPKLMYLFSKRFVDEFVTISQSTMRSMVSTGRVADDKITLIYPGIKTWEESELEKYRSEGKKYLEKFFVGKAPIVGFVGRLASENELDVLLRACQKLSMPVRMLIIGDGPEKNEYQALAKKLGLHAHFTGFISETEKFSLLTACDVFAYVRAWPLDGFGITTIEALSVGVPVIAPRFGPQQEIITDGKSGLSFEPHDAKDLAKKLARVLKDKKLARHLHEEGLMRAKAFNEEKSLQQLQNLISRFNAI